MSEVQDPKDVAVTDTDLNSARIDQREKSLFYRIMYESYKGHYRGLLFGIVLGGLVGAAIGLALCALPGVIAGSAIGITLISSVAAGALMIGDSFSTIGTASSARASSLAEKHARFSDPMYKGNKLGAIDDYLMTDGRNHHYEYPPERDKGKPFYWKSGITGGLIASAFGALVGSFGAMSQMLPATFPLLATNPIGVGILVFGALGVTFGINRSVFKTIANQTDANTQGKVYSEGQAADLGKAQFAGIENDKQLLTHRIERQNDTQILTKQYNEDIWWGALGGRFRGFAQGAVTGALVGLAIGIAAIAVMWAPFLAAAALHLGAAAALHPVAGLGTTLLPFISGAGALFGSKVFADAGTEAGAESRKCAIEEEFQRNSELRAKGLPIPPKEKPKQEKWFNGKAALVTGLIGAAVGLVLAPYLGAGIVGMIATKSTIFAAHLAATHSAVGLSLLGVKMTMSIEMLSSVVAGGLIGATYGIGRRTLKAIGNLTTHLFDASYSSIHSPKIEQSHTLSADMPAPVRSLPSRIAHEQITPEEMATLREKQASGSGKNFGQTITQQLQTAAATPITMGGA